MQYTELIECFRDTMQMACSHTLRKITENAIQNQKLYMENFQAKYRKYNTVYAEVFLEQDTSFAAAKKHLKNGKVAVLNFANPVNPGDGVVNGAMAQEECLCRSSNLYSCISNENVFNGFYGYHRSLNNYIYSDRLIYTKNVTVFKNDDTIPQLMPQEEWFKADVITCSAPYVAERKYMNEKILKELFKAKIKNIFESAIDNDVDVLILGAFGCGAFKNPPDIVANAFYEVIVENDYDKSFREIVFAIKSSNDNDPFEPCPNILAFESVFCRDAGCHRVEQASDSIEMPSGGILKGERELERYLEWRKNSPYFGKKFSILGDSISTLEGYNPDGYGVFYNDENCKRANIMEAGDTWWGQVLEYFKAQLLVNNSWSGSRVTKLPNQDELFPSGCSDERISSLHINSVKPDVIIIYLGTNDWAVGVDMGLETRLLSDIESELFVEAYKMMIRKIKRNYPDSEIWCCTLSETYVSVKPEFCFPHKYAGIHIEDYNSIIRRTVKDENCRLIDLYDMNMPYDTIDGSHPNKEGMKTIAASVCYAMADPEGRKFLAPAAKKIGKEFAISSLTGDMYQIEKEPYVGSLIGDRYQIIKEIINVGRTKEYIVTGWNNKRYVAKSICKEVEEKIDMDMLRKLSHPYIRKYYCIVEDKTGFYIIMELVEGVGLKILEKESGGVLPVKKAVKYSIQIAEALRYIHFLTPPVLFRNVNPKDIVIDTNDNVRLMNLSMAIRYTPGQDMLLEMGTRGYTPPEAICGGVVTVTLGYDIYSLGITMNQMLTGVDFTQFPYEIIPIRRINPSLPEGLEYIILKCLEKDPDKRYQDFGDIIRDLKDYENISMPKSLLEKLFRR